MDSPAYLVSALWHAILMNGSTAEDVNAYPELMKHTPVEIRILLLAGGSPHWLLRDYAAALHLPKSTLTSIVNRLERQEYLRRVISQKDKRSYALALEEKGRHFLQRYQAYQAAFGSRILAGLEPGEREQLLALLQKIASYMIEE